MEKRLKSGPKVCSFCGCENGFLEEFCMNCKRPLDREKLKDMAEAHERAINNKFMQKRDQFEKMIEKIAGKKG